LNNKVTYTSSGVAQPLPGTGSGTKHLSMAVDRLVSDVSGFRSCVRTFPDTSGQVVLFVSLWETELIYNL